MPTPRESALSDELVELRAWYVEDLLPKLARATGSGIVEFAAVDELERRFCELLRLVDTHAEAA